MPFALSNSCAAVIMLAPHGRISKWLVVHRVAPLRLALIGIRRLYPQRKVFRALLRGFDPPRKPVVGAADVDGAAIVAVVFFLFLRTEQRAAIGVVVFDHCFLLFMVFGILASAAASAAVDDRNTVVVCQPAGIGARLCVRSVDPSVIADDD